MHPFWILLARLILGSVWLVASLSKLLAGQPQAHSVEEFGLLPRWAARAVGVILPLMELSLGLLLLVGLWMVPAALVSIGMLTIFSLAIMINLLRGRKIECHCFGQLSHARITWLTVLRNAAFLAVALGIIQYPTPYLTIEGWLRGTTIRPTDPPAHEFVPVLFIALSISLVWILADQVWRVAMAVAKAKDGPALGSNERIYLRRLLNLDSN